MGLIKTKKIHAKKQKWHYKTMKTPKVITAGQCWYGFQDIRNECWTIQQRCTAESDHICIKINHWQRQTMYNCRETKVHKFISLRILISLDTNSYKNTNSHTTFQCTVTGSCNTHTWCLVPVADYANHILKNRL